VTVLVFGASGFTGRHLVSATPPNVDVVPVDFPASPAGGLACDALDADQVASVVRAAAPSGVISLVGPRPGASPADTWAACVLASRAILESVRELPHPARVLLIGSAAEYGPSDSPAPVQETAALRPVTAYGIGKAGQTHLARYYARRYALPVVVARTFNLVGPGLPRQFVAGRIAAQIVALERGLAPPVVQVHGLGTVRDFVDVRDAVTAYWLLLGSGTAGSVYNISSGEGHSIQDLVDRFRRLATRDFQVVVEPPADRPSADRSVGDPAVIMRETGWRPTIALDQSLRDMLDFCRDATPGRSDVSGTVGREDGRESR